VRTLASIAKAAIDAFADRRDPSSWTGVAAGASDRTLNAPLTKLAEETSQSLIADVEKRAQDHRAQLQTAGFRLDDAVVANAYSFEHHLLGVATGIRDGVMVMSAAWEPRVLPWLCHRLQDFLPFDLAIFRVTGPGMARVVSTPLLIRNRVMTAMMSAYITRAPVPAGDMLLLRNTRAARIKQRACILTQPGSRIAQLSARLDETLATQTPPEG